MIPTLSQRFSRFAPVIPQWLAATLIVVAIVAGTFLQGVHGELLVIAEVALLLCAAMVLWQGYARGWKIPFSALTWFVTAYWVWLAATIIWSRVPYHSAFIFWVVASFPFVFWLQLFMSQWSHQQNGLKLIVFFLAIVLAGGGIVEFFVWGTGPQLMFLNRNSYGGLLNVVSIPVAAYLAVAISGAKRFSYRTIAVSAGFWLLVYAVALTTGRGSLISFILALSIVGVALARQLPMRALVAVVAIAGSAIALSHVDFGQLMGGTLGRFGALTDSQGSVWQRWLIWKGSWELLADAPWWGIGIGVYGMAWQRFRHPDDSSSGSLAHNDYLQMWIEVGLPGLILFLCVLVLAAWTFLRVLRHSKRKIVVRAEAAGLFASIFAVSLHSVVDFNFHIVPTLILFGLMLARLQILRAQVEPKHTHMRTIKPSHWSSPFGFRAVTVLLIAFPLLYFLVMTLSIYKTREAIDHEKVGRFDLAETALFSAARINPSSDDVRITLASLYRHAIKVIPESEVFQRQELFKLAQESLDKATRVNPLRVHTYVVRAFLYVENPQFLDGDPVAQTRAVFDQALSINPRALEVRYDYAQYLASLGLIGDAREVMDAGLRHLRVKFPRFAPYYLFTAKLHRSAGDQAGAAALEQSVREFAPSAIAE